VTKLAEEVDLNIPVFVAFIDSIVTSRCYAMNGFLLMS
jgi:hypothetical protein